MVNKVIEILAPVVRVIACPLQIEIQIFFLIIVSFKIRMCCTLGVYSTWYKNFRIGLGAFFETWLLFLNTEES